MKSKIWFVLVAVAVLIIGGFFFTSRYLASRQEHKAVVRAKVVTPKTAASDDSDSLRLSASGESESFSSLMTLLPTETLLGSLVVDLNNDTYDDEVIIVRKASSPYIFVIPGIYDSDSMTYRRIAEIQTTISKTRTFSFTGIDIIGDHQNELVYQGDDDFGNYVMQIFQFRQNGGRGELAMIGDFVSDGTVFIQQTERSESYALSLSRGESFSVWVYKSDKTSSGTNQIQQEYKWNSRSEKYELAQEIKVNADRLESKALSRIQDGTVETFAAFLDGLWYKVSNSESEIRYVYFDHDSNEIIQVKGDIQEVYEWEDSKLRHNGIYLTTVNSSISTLHRRFDISLTNIDEIRITIHDAINLAITENSLWDGQYKKMSLQSSFDEGERSDEIDRLVQELKKGDNWISADTLSTISFSDLRYSFHTENFSDTGLFYPMQIGSYNVLQLKSDTGVAYLSEMYSVRFGTKTITQTIRRQTVEKVVDDIDVLLFEPVKITPTDCFATEGRMFTFTREKTGEGE